MQNARAQNTDNPDQDDVSAARNGDQRAFEKLYQRHCNWLFGLCWRLAGGDRGLAEDWLQDTFVRAWHKLDRYAGKGSFAGWLRRLCINLALADKRLQQSRLRLHSDSLDATQLLHHQPVALIAPAPPWQGADIDLERAITQLPERARIVLVLYAIEGYSHEEIAQLTQMAVGSSKAQLHRARQLLKDRLA